MHSFIQLKHALGCCVTLVCLEACVDTLHSDINTSVWGQTDIYLYSMQSSWSGMPPEKTNAKWFLMYMKIANPLSWSPIPPQVQVHPMSPLKIKPRWLLLCLKMGPFYIKLGASDSFWWAQVRLVPAGWMIKGLVSYTVHILTILACNITANCGLPSIWKNLLANRHAAESSERLQRDVPGLFLGGGNLDS